MPQIALAAMAVGTVMQVGQIRAEGKAQANETAYARGQALKNANLTEMAGAEEVKQIRRKAETVVASQRAAYAGAGVSITGGTPLEVMSETARQAEEDAQTTVRDTNVQAQAFYDEAELLRQRKKWIRRTTRARMASSLLMGAAQVGVSAYMMRGAAAGGSAFAAKASANAPTLNSWLTDTSWMKPA